MFSHVHIGITDFERAFAFYSGVMDELGFTLKFSEPEKPWAGWMQPGRDRPLFLIGRPYNGKRAAPGNGQMVALLAPNRGAVDRCYASAIANGHEAKVSRVSGRTIILTTMAHISVTWMATSSASAATTHQSSDLSRSAFSFGMMLAAMGRASSRVSSFAAARRPGFVLENRP
jgi:catechol 2,3-dioxygenase-like lactoylglutathione lyase family enzyme